MTGWEEMHLVGPHKPVRASFSIPLCKGNDIPSSKNKKTLSKYYHASAGEICTSRRGSRCLVWVKYSLNCLGKEVHSEIYRSEILRSTQGNMLK